VAGETPRGALGLEALSRGATHAVFVESDREALKVLARNVAALGADSRSTIITGDALGVGTTRSLVSGPFALLLLDPPYRIERTAVADLLDRVMGAGALATDGFVAVEHASTGGAPLPASLELVRTYRYGDTALSVYRSHEGKVAP
jgi:16S rRNA (guanine966-N2)-methyltransferase